MNKLYIYVMLLYKLHIINEIERDEMLHQMGTSVSG
ncbi:hypothetical protein JOC93_002667 [Priestia taiwanensis]|nr:hypothetical protein [Priestia taiwanensis]